MFGYALTEKAIHLCGWEKPKKESNNMNTPNYLEIEIKVEERTNREKGNKFNIFKALTNVGKWIDCRMRKEVVAPKENCIIVVDPTKINVTKNTKYPVLWVQEIKTIKPLKDVYKTRMEDAIKEAQAIFGTATVKVEKEELPFK